MDIKKEGGKAVKWSLLDKLLKRGVQFVLSIFLARLLAPSDFGVIAMAAIFVGWGEVFRDFGLGQALVQRKTISEAQTSTIFYLNILMGCLIAGILFMIAPLAADFYDNHMVGWVVRITGITFIINGLNVVQNSLLIKELNYRIGTVSSFLASVLSGIIGIMMAFWGFGVWSLLAQSVSSAIIATIYIWYKSTWRPKLIFRFKDTTPLFRKGVGFMGQGLVDNVFNFAGTMVIGKIFSPGILGIYDRGYSLSEMINSTVVLPVTRPLFPVFAKLQDNINKLTDYYIKILDTMNWILILTAGVLLLCSKEIILLILGEKWIETAEYFFLFSWIAPLYANWSIITSLWKGLGLVRKVTMITFIEKSMFILAIPALFVSLKIYAICIVGAHLLANVIKSMMNAKITGISVAKQYKEWTIEMLCVILVLFGFQFIHIGHIFLSMSFKIGVLAAVYIIVSTMLHLRGFATLKQQLIDLKSNIRKR